MAAQPPSPLHGHPGPGGTLILSPHPDDAALSVGGAILAGALPLPVRVLTLFGRTSWADGRFHSDWEAVSRRRAAEDRAWAGIVGVELVPLGFPDASLRGDGVLFTREAVTVEDATFDTIAAAAAEPALVLAPLGLGGHIDHLVAFDAARRLRRPMLAWEDLPYAAALPPEEIARHARNGECTPVPIGPVLHRKLAALRVYRSQLGPEDIATVQVYAGRPAVERLWKVG